MQRKSDNNSDFLPLISVVIPSFNQGHFLSYALDSIIIQDYPSCEIIVIDGGSLDETLNVIKRYEKSLNYWVSESDQGQSHALNKGFSRATGDIITWLNSDDAYCVGAFKRIAEVFNRCPHVDVVHGERILINSANEVVGWTRQPCFDPSQYGYNIFSETVFWRHTVMQRVSRVDESLEFAMDLDLFCRMYRDFKFKKLNHPLGYYRSHLDCKSARMIEVGMKEGQNRWHLYFGKDNHNFAIPAPISRLSHYFQSIRYPFLIFLPYIRFRTIKLLKRLLGKVS
jgi:glycosyltransferase involved in cell wall biosynthesis